MLKHLIIAAAIGLSVQLDIFYMAMAFLGIFVFTWGQMLEVMAVPNLVDLIKNKKQKEFSSLVSGLFTMGILFSIVIAAILFVERHQIVKLAWGFDADNRNLLANSLIWFAPVMLLYIPFHYMGSVFRAARRFSVFYQAEFIIGIVSLVLIIFFKNDPHILLWSFSVGMISAFFYLLYFYSRQYKLWGNPFSRIVFNSVKIAPGLFVLQCAQYVYILTDRIFISFLENGSIGALAYGRTLAFFVEGLVGIKGSFITVFAEAEDLIKKNELYNNLISLSICIALPLTGFFLVFGKNIISVFLERGMFSHFDTEMVYLALSGFSWSLLPMILQVPMEQIFQIYGKINLMVQRKLVGLVANLTLNYIFLFVLEWGVWGIALATSISFWTVLLYGFVAAKNFGLVVNWKRHAPWTLWIISGTIIVSYALVKVGSYFDAPITIFFQMITFGVLIMFIGINYQGLEGTLIKDVIKRVLASCR